MKFDKSKVIENPTSLPDGEYYVGDTFDEVESDLSVGFKWLEYSVRDNTLSETGNVLSYWKYYYPISILPTHTNTHRTKHRRVLAPLWERTKQGK